MFSGGASSAGRREGNRCGQAELSRGAGGRLQAPDGISTVGRVPLPRACPAGWWAIRGNCQALAVRQELMAKSSFWGSSIVCPPKWPPLFPPSSCWASAGLTLKGQNCSHSGTRQVPKLRLDTRQSSYTSCQSILAATPGRSLGSPRFADEETVTCPSHTARKRWSYGWVQVCLVPVLCHCLHATPPPPHQLASFHELEGPQDSQLSSPQSS